MPWKDRKSISSIQVGAAKQLKRLKATLKLKKLPLRLHPRQFSEEAFEWHRTSMMTPVQFMEPTDTVLWYLNSQQEYFNQIKAEVTGKFIFATPADDDDELDGNEESTQPKNSLEGVQNLSSEEVTEKFNFATPSDDDAELDGNEESTQPKNSLEDAQNLSSEEVTEKSIFEAGAPVKDDINDNGNEEVTQPGNSMVALQNLFFEEATEKTIFAAPAHSKDDIANNGNEEIPRPANPIKKDVQNLSNEFKAEVIGKFILATPAPFSSDDIKHVNEKVTPSKTSMEILQNRSSEKSDDPLDTDPSNQMECNRNIRAIQVDRPTIMSHVFDEGQGDVLQLDYEENDDYLVF